MRSVAGRRNAIWLLVAVLLIGSIGTVTTWADASVVTTAESSVLAAQLTATPAVTTWSTDPDPLQIEQMRMRGYPGSEITFEQTLAAGASYYQYIVSYLSDGYQVYALMTIPFGERPATGWPVIVFNHGYIAPTEYTTTGSYVAYADTFANHGYIVFKSDYRGHGNSGGGPEIGGGYGTPDYTVDVLNAIAALKAYPDADPNRIGMWGHSMGGQITLRAMVVSQDIKAGVIWGGVVAPYPDVIARWDFVGRAREMQQSEGAPAFSGATGAQSGAFRWGQSFSSWVGEFSTKYGTAEQNPGFWATISPNTYLADLSGPLQLHHSTTDEMVPLAWSQILATELQTVGSQSYEFYTYEGDNHNISANFVTAMQRTVFFFDTYVKGQ